MTKAVLKTQKTTLSVNDFLKNIKDEEQREDAIKINSIIEEITGEKGKMWGAAIIGYVDTHLKYESGRELDWFKVGFSPRKGKTTIYLNYAYYDKFPELMEKLGKYKTGKGCLYINSLKDIDQSILKKLIAKSLA